MLTYNEVMESSPKDLESFDIAHKMWFREQNEIAYLHGAYVLEAIGSCFDKNHHYPKEPYELNDNLNTDIDEESNERLAVAEMEQYIKQLTKEGKKKQTKVGVD